jgi:hypothetical protein
MWSSQEIRNVQNSVNKEPRLVIQSQHERHIQNIESIESSNNHTKMILHLNNEHCQVQWTAIKNKH